MNNDFLKKVKNIIIIIVVLLSIIFICLVILNNIKKENGPHIRMTAGRSAMPFSFAI